MAVLLFKFHTGTVQYLQNADVHQLTDVTTSLHRKNHLFSARLIVPLLNVELHP
jgi:hypothetical protein